MLQATFATGDTCSYPPESTEREIYASWIEVPSATYVACSPEGRIVGVYYLKPNQPGLGSHVCNCGYVVSPDARGQGIAAEMCRHSQAVAVEMGFLAMQFNLVVATNVTAVRLWQKLGFAIIGALPKAFLHRSMGYVDALIMYKQLSVPAMPEPRN